MSIKRLFSVLAAGAFALSAIALPDVALAGVAPTHNSSVVSTHEHAPGTAPHSHGASASAENRCEAADEFSRKPGLGDRVCAMGNGLFKVRTERGDLITHGVDSPALSTTEASAAEASGTQASVAALASQSYFCTTDSYRMQLIYLIPAGAPNASGTMVPLIRQHFIQANDMVSNRAASLRGDLSLRVACDAAGQPSVLVLQSSHNNADIGAIDSELARLGQRILGQDNVAYWGDGGCGGGVAWGSGDTRPGVENTVNDATGTAVVYGQCPFTVLLHEQGHSMGAVLPGSPNDSGTGHCNDDSDVMCYPDGGPRSSAYRTDACAAPYGNLDYFWDCNADDYFHPNPPAGSFLATNWNLANCNNRIIHRPNCGSTTPAARRIQSQNFQDWYVRHANFDIRLDPNVSPVQDSQFRLVPGLANASSEWVSFESVNFPGYYLRHAGFDFSLVQSDGSAAFKGDATFRWVPGLADSSATSFQSYNFPDRYIRHANGLLRLDAIGTAERGDATFRVVN